MTVSREKCIRFVIDNDPFFFFIDDQTFDFVALLDKRNKIIYESTRVQVRSMNETRHLVLTIQHYRCEIVVKLGLVKETVIAITT